MTPRALLLQELCCTIAEFLGDSPDDLISCALVSPHLTAAAQRILFHDIIFNRRCQAVGDLGLLPQYDESRACARFCAVVTKSPHLIPLVRRIRISLEHEVGNPLSAIKFPNLNDLVLHGQLRSHGVDITRTPAAALLRTPSLRRVGLVWPIFRDPQDLYSLFNSISPTVGFLSLQRVLVEDGHSLPIPAADYSASKIKSLRLHRLYIHDPHCLGPFDLSGLRELDYGNSLTPVFARVLEEARESFVCLTLNVEQAVKSLPSLLGGLPALTDLTLVSDAGTSAGIETLLSSLHASSLVARLSLQLGGGTLDVETAGLIARACANAPACVVTVWFKASDLDLVSHLQATMRSAFAGEGGKGVFDVIGC